MTDIGGGFAVHFRHSREGGNPYFCHLAVCAKAQTAIYRRKWQTPAAALIRAKIYCCKNLLNASQAEPDLSQP